MHPCDNCNHLQAQLDEGSRTIEDLNDELSELRRRAARLDKISREAQALIDKLSTLI